jgi:hypothetical protein
MNWKNIYYLMQVERKSGRLLRGIKPTKYHENRYLANWPYFLAVGIGLAVGVLVGYFVNLASAEIGASVIETYAIQLFVSLPTLVLVYNLVLTLLQQIQRSGVKFQAETPYWLPVTWQEHTIASILASLSGIPIGSVLLLVSAILAFSVFNGLFVSALLTSIVMLVAALMASLVTEILRVIQVRFTGAIYKSSGRAAIYLRFIGSFAFFVAFYAVYLYITQGGYQFVSTLTETQSTIFYVPFVWLGIMLSYFVGAGANLLFGLVFLALSIGFLAILYFLAVALNKRFGLYEPPAIKVQKSGIYAPKTGILGKFGFSNSESALIHKDLKAFTRRKELMSVFIAPIVIILIPVMQSLNMTGNSSIPSQVSFFYLAMTYLFPAALMVMTLGSLLIGEEGQAIWRIYASPISAKNLVKSKYFFLVLFGVAILLATGTIGSIIYHPSVTMMVVAFLEAFFLIIALGAISLNIGFRGADFTEIPRPRMVRQYWALINMGVCALVGLVILAPLVPNAFAIILDGVSIGFNIPSLPPYIATTISGVIAAIFAVVFYKITLDSAKAFLRKAEV